MNTAQKITAIFDDIQQVSSEVSATAFCIEELAENLHGRWEDKARNENCELTEDEENELINQLTRMLAGLESAELSNRATIKMVKHYCSAEVSA